MRINLLAMGVLFSLLVLSGCNAKTEASSEASGVVPSGDIAWHETLDSGLNAAKAENKLVFVDFSAEW